MITTTQHNRQPRALSPEELIEFLRTNVRLDGECRLWAGAKRANGRPRITWHRRNHLAQRLYLQLLGHSVTPAVRVWVTCGNAGCMNEAHLRYGTHQRALRASVRRGAFLSGPQRALVSLLTHARTARFPITEFARARQMRLEGVTCKAIGERYGVSGSSVSQAMRRWEATGLTPAHFSSPRSPNRENNHVRNPDELTRLTKLTEPADEPALVR